MDDPIHIRAFECSVKGTDWRRTVHAQTAGKARYQYWIDVRESWESVKLTDVRVRLCVAQTDDAFRRTANYRGVQFARIGMRVRVGGDLGVIVGHNSSANFNVLFLEGDFHGQVLNCHPNHQMEYLNG